MKKILAAIATAFLLPGCGMVERASAQLTGYSKTCIEGVTYLQFSSGAAVQVDKTGKPVTCNN